MNIKKFENVRFTPKGDIEANWNKAIGFIPLDKEIIIYKADENHDKARIKIGDGNTPVQALKFIGADDIKLPDNLATQEWVTEQAMLLSENIIQHLDGEIASIDFPTVDQEYSSVSSNAQSGIAVNQALDTKLDKSGGLIDGDLSITGSLNVSGTTTTKDTETVLVKDNIIVANSDGNKLIEEAGFAVKTGVNPEGEEDTNAAYGIMYDPVGDGVKIGFGAFDENGKFEYGIKEDGVSSEAQFLATRDNIIADGNLVKWDDTAKKLVDAGTITCETIGALPKVFDLKVSQSIIKISKDGEVTTNQITSEIISSAVVERVGSGNIKVPEIPDDNSFATSKKYVDDLVASIDTPDVSEYAKLTDLSNDTYIASTSGANGATSNAGLFKYEQEGGFFKSASYGSNPNSIRIKKASRSVINDRTCDMYQDSGTYGAIHSCPIVPSTLDYALFSGFTNSKTENILTDTNVEGLWNFETFISEVVDGKFKLKGLRRVNNSLIEIEVTMYKNNQNQIVEINENGDDVRVLGTVGNNNIFTVNISTHNRYFPDFIQYKYVVAENAGENDKIYTVNTRKKALDILGVTTLIESLTTEINTLKEEIKTLKGEA